MQSPAFQFFFDRKGTLEQTFKNFTKMAGCAGQGIACLRAASAETLDKANFDLNVQGEQGTFAVGPSPDGDFIRQSPALEFASGMYLLSYPLPSCYLQSLLNSPKETTTSSQPPSSSPTSPTNPTSSSPPALTPTPTSQLSLPPSSPPTPLPPASTPPSKPAILPLTRPNQTTAHNVPACTMSSTKLSSFATSAAYPMRTKGKTIMWNMRLRPDCMQRIYSQPSTT